MAFGLVHVDSIRNCGNRGTARGAAMMEMEMYAAVVWGSMCWAAERMPCPSAQMVVTLSTEEHGRV